MIRLLQISAIIATILGVVWMESVGAPRRYEVVNLASLVIGLAAFTLAGPVALHHLKSGEALTVLAGLAVLLTALFGVEVDSVSRWVTFAGLSFQPSLIFIPVAILIFATRPSWLSLIGLALAAIGVSIQPDRAVAAMMAAGLLVVYLNKKHRVTLLAAGLAMIALITTLLNADPLAPVKFVEGVVADALSAGLTDQLTVFIGLAVLLLPAFAFGLKGLLRRTECQVFAVIWSSLILASVIGPYPTPFIGYGASSILGYCLCALALPRRRT